MPPTDPIAEIRRLYFAATRATIQADLLRAIELLKGVPTEEERERAAVYMDGLSEMRSDWAVTSRPARPSSAPRSAAAPARSDRSRRRAGPDR